ncbi:N-acetylgalactosamine kinase [Phytophthora ramorum]|uniref:N-acetylgalactosamine kinase n=1 Tax=Phytophthora ramorum TaxID=164328 RepID=UPI0030AB9FEB|nr:N-acetylgalactosamine kinase [Phytophthora ramorum]
MDLFPALPLPSTGDEANKRLLQVMRAFEDHFGRLPTGVTRAPGRVNLIGEHVDYEGYAVLPMAIEQSVYVAFDVVQTEESSANSAGVRTLSVANAKSSYKSISFSMEEKEQENMQTLEKEGAAWAKYVLCGVLGVQDERPGLFGGERRELQMLVDGDIPVGCGLSSSSALVVASALATSSALQTTGITPFSRMEMAELCRRAEHRVGTMGGGMDQAVACLAQRGVALHLDFSSVPAASDLVSVPDDAAGVTFVVANSLVVAEKAVDAATRFNKRVVECALAAKMIAKRAGIEKWKSINRLVDVQLALNNARGESISYTELQELASTACSLREYNVHELEDEFGVPVIELFSSSSLEAASKEVLITATPLKLQQRALHVWSEAKRVEEFREICVSLANNVQQSSDQSPFTQKQVVQLGEVMNASHNSCKTLYECSCPELDALVDAAISAGALGARLTGAGWGGCIVTLVKKDEVSNFMKRIRSSYYHDRGRAATNTLDAMFESAPAPGAEIFSPQLL